MESTSQGQAFDLPNLIGLLDLFNKSISLSPLVITIARYDDGSCVYVSPSFRDMTGHDPSTLLKGGMNWFVNHLHHEDRPQFKINFSEGLLFMLELPVEQRLRCYINLTVRFIHHYGNPIWIYYQCRPVGLDPKGKPLYMLNMLTDITYMKRDHTLHPCWSVLEQTEGAKPIYLGGSGRDSMPWLFGSVTSPLTKKETQVLKGFMKGLSGKELGSRMKLSINTVNSHRKSIIRKCKAKNMSQAIEKAMQNDWINE